MVIPFPLELMRGDVGSNAAGVVKALGDKLKKPQ
jgi:hypothetical protein